MSARSGILAQIGTKEDLTLNGTDIWPGRLAAHSGIRSMIRTLDNQSAP